MSRIGGRVGEHGGGEWPARPVGLLVLFGELHAYVLLEQRRQAHGGLASELRGDPGVEQPSCAESVIPVEGPQVIVGVVEDLFDFRVGEQAADRGEVRHRQRVDDHRAGRTRQLDEKDPVAVAVEARGLRVRGDERFSRECRDRLRERFRCADVAHSSLPRALGLAELALKREDRASQRYGGNKVRGLEFLLAGASPGTVFVTVGGTGSTHCLATAVHAAAAGGRAALAQFPQPVTPLSEAVATACEQRAALVVRARMRATLPVAILEAWRRARALGPRRWIPGGGAHPRAVVGPLLAGLELTAQTAHP